MINIIYNIYTIIITCAIKVSRILQETSDSPNTGGKGNINNVPVHYNRV